MRMLEKLLSADEIIEFVEQRLSIREKADAFQSIRRENNPRLPRSVREAQIWGRKKLYAYLLKIVRAKMIWVMANFQMKANILMPMNLLRSPN